MNSKQDPSIDWDGSSTESLFEVSDDFTDTFCLRREDSNLELTRSYDEAPDDDLKGESGLPTKISNVAELNYYAGQPDKSQIFCIYQRNSYSRLYITHELFQELVSACSIFSRIWDFVLPFHFQVRESDIGHAPFKLQQLKHAPLGEQKKKNSFECAYSFRYVIPNQREKKLFEDPDYDPWSIRQTTVYQKYQGDIDKMTFVLIAPSDPGKTGLDTEIFRSKGNRLSAFSLHQVILSALKENWRLYIRSLEHILKDQSDRVTLAKVRSEIEPRSSLPELIINFVDRQRIKRIEDKVLNLMIIFDSLHDTLSQLQRQCRRHCLGPFCENCKCYIAVEEFEEQISEIQLNLKRVDILHKRVQGIAQLLSDLLSYENSKSLNSIAEETRDENGKMRTLTERSTMDSAAVKILTVITLIYLPVTVVADFFSTQLIHVDDNGTVSIAKDSWWFAVVAVPLTVATILAWKYWLYASMKGQDRWQEGPQKPGKWSKEGLQWLKFKIFDCTKRMERRFAGLRNRRQKGIDVELP